MTLGNISSGTDDMEGNSFYGTDLVSSVKNAAIRGVRTGAVGFVAGIVGSFRPPFGMARAPGGDAEALARLTQSSGIPWQGVTGTGYQGWESGERKSSVYCK